MNGLYVRLDEEARPFHFVTAGIAATTYLYIAQLVTEALPLGKLIAVFGALSLIPYGIAVFAFPHSIISAVLIVVGQFILATGAGIVLMYVIARGLRLTVE